MDFGLVIHARDSDISKGKEQSMNYGGPVVLGGATVAALPATGGSRSVVTYVALASVAFGVAVLVSTAARVIAKRISA